MTWSILSVPAPFAIQPVDFNLPVQKYRQNFSSCHSIGIGIGIG